jgi:Holliday junction resolvasome RuvABC endonuclease subunit
MAVLALDLGCSTGWALWSEGGVQSGTWKMRSPTKKACPDPRISIFEDHILALETQYRIAQVAYELVWAHCGTQAAHMYGRFEGVVHNWTNRREIMLRGVGVGTIKKHATGTGAAKKPAMMEAARLRWPTQDVRDDNQADALCLLAYALETT